jgi:hypothetical protein
MDWQNRRAAEASRYSSMNFTSSLPEGAFVSLDFRAGLQAAHL